MGPIQIVIGVIQLIVAVGLIVIIVLQKGNEGGLSSSLGGGSSDSFFGKNKGNTIESKMKKWTIIGGATLAILTIVLDVLALVQ